VSLGKSEYDDIDVCMKCDRWCAPPQRLGTINLYIYASWRWNPTRGYSAYQLSMSWSPVKPVLARRKRIL
jgi:hypothetical protein